MKQDPNNKELEKNHKQTIACRREILKGLRVWYILLLFTALYLVVLLVYSVSLKTFLGSNILAFLTSPFNFVEDFSKVYKSPMEGYWLNAGFTAFIISVSIVYAQLLASSKRVKPELVFWTSILASYLVSIFVWRFNGMPSTGTSIIGFCMTAFLLLSSLHDLPAYFKKLRNKLCFLTIGKLFAINLVFVFSLVVLLSYWLGNSSYPYHFVGGAICGVLILAIVKR